MLKKAVRLIALGHILHEVIPC